MKKRYSIDELGEMIVPGPLSKKDIQEVREAIEEYKRKRKKSKKQGTRKLEV